MLTRERSKLYNQRTKPYNTCRSRSSVMHEQKACQGGGHVREACNHPWARGTRAEVDVRIPLASTRVHVDPYRRCILCTCPAEPPGASCACIAVGHLDRIEHCVMHEQNARQGGGHACGLDSESREARNHGQGGRARRSLLVAPARTSNVDNVRARQGAGAS